MIDKEFDRGSFNRIQKLLSLGNDPPNDLKFLINDITRELKERGITEHQLKGIELVINIAFRLGEKNAALKIARGGEP
jgi:hypothetical protein